MITMTRSFKTDAPQDQHLCVPEIPGLKNHSLFAVFDGHGGKNAAIFAAKELLGRLQQTSGYNAYLGDQVRFV
jgi:serine/threonine protein phosphatase PrpC